MTPSQINQNGIVKTLPAEADAVDPMVEAGQQRRLIETCRIHLEGDFRTLLESITATELIEQTADLIRTQQRRGTASEIHS